MTEYGVTAAGFVPKPLPVILQELEQRQRADIDPEWNTDADSLAGQLNGIVADQLTQLHELLEGVYYSLSRDGAMGASLDIIGALSGSRRKAATKSTVELVLNLSAGTTVLAGAIISVAGNPSIRVVTTETATNPTGVAANIAVDAEAAMAGPVTAVLGTLTTIETPVSGWNSATNPEPLGGGAAIESDAAYYQRQLDELAAGGGGTLPGLRADLLRVPGVHAVILVENDTDAPVDGMPPHSFEAIVLADEDPVTEAAIAQSIWNNKPAGVRSYGTAAEVSIDDEWGYEHLIQFSRPILRPAYAAIAVDVGEGYAGGTAVEDAVADAVAAAAINPDDPSFLETGGDVYAGRMICTALRVSGVLNARVGLSFSRIDDPDAGTSSLAITGREIASLPAANISVTS